MKVIEGQSAIDIAIILSGTTESVFDICNIDNRSITDIIFTGDEITHELIANPEVKNYYNSRNLQPATDINIDLANEILGDNRGDGIGYWRIEYELIIS